MSKRFGTALLMSQPVRPYLFAIPCPTLDLLEHTLNGRHDGVIFSSPLFH
jgi:hypothetical protein